MDITVKKIGETEKEYIEIGCHKKDERIDEIVRFIRSREGILKGTKEDRQYSIALPDMLVRVLTQEVGVSLLDTVKMLTAVPARILGLHKGVLSEGFDADVIAFDDQICVQSAFVSGVEVF